MTKIFAILALALATASPALAAPFTEQQPWFQAKEEIRFYENATGSDSN